MSGTSASTGHAGAARGTAVEDEAAAAGSAAEAAEAEELQRQKTRWTP